MKDNIKQKVMNAAWELVKTAKITISEALRKAWNLVKVEILKNLLKFKKVIVTFQKVNGEITTRTATVNLNFIPQGQHPKGNGQSCEKLINFFSLTDNGWRSLRIENLISFKSL